MKANVLKGPTGTSMIYPHEEWILFENEQPIEYKHVLVNLEGTISRAMFIFDIEHNPVWLILSMGEEGICCQEEDLWQYIVYEN